MTIWQVQVTLGASSGIPADDIVNTFHVDQFTTTNPTDAATPIEAFYAEINQYLSLLVSRGANRCETKIYDLADPIPRQPILSRNWTLPAAAAVANLPPEVACCLSFRAAPLSGDPAARRRGRVYIGPLNDNANGGAILLAAFIEDLVDAGVTMAQALETNGCPLGIYSTVNADLSIAQTMWVDNAVDIQRRRGRDATIRETRTI